MKEWWETYFNKYYSLTSFASGLSSKTEVEFILSKCKISNSASILDMCCGDGRHSLELLTKQYSVNSIDYSDVLLEKAKSKCSKYPFWKYSNIDIRKFSEIDKYELSICIGGLGFFMSENDNVLAIDKLSCSVKPGGYLFIDHQDPEYYKARSELKRTYAFPKGIKIIDNRCYSEEKRGLIITREIFQKDNLLENSQQFIRLYSRYEISNILKMHNFINIEFFNSYSSDSLNNDTPKLIVIGKRR